MGYTPDVLTGKPLYDDVSNTQSDLQAGVDYAEQGLGEHKATIAGLPASGGKTGRAVWIDAEKGFRVWDGTKWAVPAGTVETPLAMQGIYKLGSPPAVAYVQDGRVYLEGFISNISTAIFVAATPYTFATIPAAIAPRNDQWLPLNWGSDGSGGLFIGADGTCIFQLGQDAGSLSVNVLRVSMSGASWRMKGV